MIKEIISTVAIVLDAQTPTITNKIIFKEMVSEYHCEDQSETFIINAYKVIDDAEGDYEFLKKLVTTLDKETLNAMAAAMKITSTTYTDIRNEQMVKGTQMYINTDGVYGLTAAQLILR